MSNQPPLHPDGVLAAKEAMRRVLELDSNEARTLAWEAIAPADYPDAVAKPMLSAYLAVAQQVVRSVESIPAQVQVISWEEEPEHECWKLAPDETFVGLIVKSDRAWTPADKYTLTIERPVSS